MISGISAQNQLDRQYLDYQFLVRHPKNIERKFLKFCDGKNFIYYDININKTFENKNQST